MDSLRETVMQERTREFSFTQPDFDFLREIVIRRAGIVVGEEKMDMFYSRLSRRLRKLGLTEFSEYCELIRAESSDCEVHELINCITTNLTSFFREKHHYDYLQQQVLPELINQNHKTCRIKIWSAGCSTGEEPYSIAISLREALPGIDNWQIVLLASDIDSQVLAKASLAVYALDRMEDIPTSRLQRWFLKGCGSNSGFARLKPEVSTMVDFRQINLMGNWLFKEQVDVIFCRNVMIYFDKFTKEKLIDRYANALKIGGYLFVGHSESLFKLSQRFELVGKSVYRKRM